MLLSARPLTDVSSVNSFEVVDVVQFNKGDVVKIYFQLIDASLDRPAQGFSPSGRRYIPAAGATLTVTLLSIDNAKTVTRVATMAFPSDDRSIWYLQMLSTDTIAGTAELLLSLNEGGVITSGRLKQAVRISTDDC